MRQSAARFATCGASRESVEAVTGAELHIAVPSFHTTEARPGARLAVPTLCALALAACALASPPPAAAQPPEEDAPSVPEADPNPATDAGAETPAEAVAEADGAPGVSAEADGAPNVWAEAELAPPLAEGQAEAEAEAMAPEGVEAEAVATGEAETAGEPGPVPYRSTSAVFTQTLGIAGLDRDAALTRNPYYAWTLSLRPRWWFRNDFFVGARFDILRELTEADDTTYDNETRIGDLSLSANLPSLYTIPGIDVGLAAGLRVDAPTSKVSRARTMRMAIVPSLLASRAFVSDTLGQLVVSYGASYGARWHAHTTAERETPLIRGCGQTEAGCGSYLNTGVRNTRHRVVHGLSLAYQPLDKLAFSLDFQEVVDFLYPLGATDPRVSHAEQPNTNRRHSSFFNIDVTTFPAPWLRITLGFSTFSPQLSPDSTYYNPFYNRFSTLNLDLAVLPAGVGVQPGARNP